MAVAAHRGVAVVVEGDALRTPDDQHRLAEPSMTPTTVRSSGGQDDGMPSGVRSQSIPLISSPVSPPPAGSRGIGHRISVGDESILSLGSRHRTLRCRIVRSCGRGRTLLARGRRRAPADALEQIEPSAPRWLIYIPAGTFDQPAGGGTRAQA